MMGRVEKFMCCMLTLWTFPGTDQSETRMTVSSTAENLNIVTPPVRYMIETVIGFIVTPSWLGIGMHLRSYAFTLYDFIGMNLR